ncbi:hypothetical protein H4582DRAFT_1966033 [Lactarius indigo]|nr:hypothetical protein H4582DRAFT_1966033 [Lactarius indigo]
MMCKRDGLVSSVLSPSLCTNSRKALLTIPHIFTKRLLKIIVPTNVSNGFSTRKIPRLFSITRVVFAYPQLILTLPSRLVSVTGTSLTFHFGAPLTLPRITLGLGPLWTFSAVVCRRSSYLYRYPQNLHLQCLRTTGHCKCLCLDDKRGLSLGCGCSEMKVEALKRR